MALDVGWCRERKVTVATATAMAGEETEEWSNEAGEEASSAAVWQCSFSSPINKLEHLVPVVRSVL